MESEPGGPADRVAPDARRDLIASLLVMAWMVEARDPYTGGHLWRSSRFGHMLAEHAGLPQWQVSRIAVGAFLHDLGKISVPDSVLRKPDKLLPAESEIMRTHPEAGWRMMAAHPLADLVAAAIRDHHERPDGQGYPRGLKGDNVPLEARAVALCDAFDAMTSTRPYRAALPVSKALDVIRRNSGTQFDTELAGILGDLAARGELDSVVGHSDDGIPLQECLTCGPTVVARSDQMPGDPVFCATCGSEYLTHRTAGGSLRVVSTGRTGTFAERSPAADLPLITRFVRDSADRLLASRSGPRGSSTPADASIGAARFAALPEDERV